MSQHSTTPSRHRVNFTTPKPAEAANNGSQVPSPANNTRAKSVPPDVKKDTKVRKSLVGNNKPKSGELFVGSQDVVGRFVNRPGSEQFARPRRQRPVLDPINASKRNEEKSYRKGLHEKLELSETLIKDLQSEVLALKVELGKANGLNQELELQNKKLTGDLAAAEAKVSALNTRQQADERAVLKHFKWPEKKADAIREAAIEYRGLKLLESEISSYKDDSNNPCETALKKMGVLHDKSERSIQKLIKLRNSVMNSYQAWEIPTDWMLDSGIVSKIKQASMRLAKMYMMRVIAELELARNSEREFNQEALLLQGLHFAYKAHQFAGGLDSETMCAFEEIRQRVPGHGGGSRELLAAIPSS